MYLIVAGIKQVSSAVESEVEKVKEAEVSLV
jgi:hypothetical protein